MEQMGATEHPKACAIYTRVSEDKELTGSSTDRQETNCRRYCEAREWIVTDVYTDIDESAFRRVGGRPDFERLLGQLSSGEFDTVVVWRLDRLARRTDDFERFWGECQRNNIAIASVTEPVDTSTGVGVAVMRMLITFAGLESTIRSDRLKARNKEAAERGEPHLPGRGFGYDQDMNVILEEAQLIREAARRVLKGESTAAIARDFAGRGLVGRRGKPWGHSSLRNVLLSRRIAGERTYLGETVVSDAWEPILTPVRAAEVRHAIANSKGGRQRRGSLPLLAGILRCGHCGVVLRRNKSNGVYLCQDHGCGGRGIAIRQTEQWVTQMVLWRLERRWPTNWRVPTLDGDRSAEMILAYDWAADTLQNINNARYIQGTLSHYEYIQLRHNLESKLGERLHAISDYVPPPALPPGFEPQRARQAWPVLSPAARQAVVELEVDRIDVLPSPVHGNWTPDRLQVTYWQPLPARAVGQEPDFPVPPSNWSRNQHPDLEPARLYQLYVAEGRSARQIADEVGIGTSAVENRLREAGIQRRTGAAQRQVRTSAKLDVETVRRLYCDERLTMAGVARVLEVGVQHVRRVLEDHNIPIRPGAPQSESAVLKLLDGLYSDPQVLAALDRHGIPHRRQVGSIHERFPDPIPLTCELVEELYADAGCSARHIELLTGNPESRVRQRMRLCDVPVRKAGMSPVNQRLRKASP